VIHVEVLFYGDLQAKLGARGEFLEIVEDKARPETCERRGATPRGDAAGSRSR